MLNVRSRTRFGPPRQKRRNASIIANGAQPPLRHIIEYFGDDLHDGDVILHNDVYSGGNQNVDSTSAQYNDLSGASATYHVTFGGAFLNTDPYPANTCPVGGAVTNCLDDAQLPDEFVIDYVRCWQRKDLASEVDGVKSTEPTPSAPVKAK